MTDTRRPSRGLFGLVVAAIAGLSLSANADTIRLDGGDIVSGKIVKKEDNNLVVNTAWGGDITIDWSLVTSIETTETAQFMLRDGTLMEASATGTGDSTISLQSGEIIKTAPIALADIQYINPPDLVTSGGVEMSGHANLGISAAAGNNDNRVGNFNTEIVGRTLDSRFTLGGRVNFKEEDGVETEDNSLAYLKYDYFVSEKWYGYTRGDFEKDKFKDLNLRTTLGLGGGYQVFERDDLKLAFELGASYVNEDFIARPLEDCEITLVDLTCPKADDDNNYAAGRWATNYEQGFFDGRMTFFHKHEILAGSDNTFLRTQTGLRFPLVLNLNATLQADIDWQENPPTDTESTDEKYIMSIGYSF